MWQKERTYGLSHGRAVLGLKQTTRIAGGLRLLPKSSLATARRVGVGGIHSRRKTPERACLYKPGHRRVCHQSDTTRIAGGFDFRPGAVSHYCFCPNSCAIRPFFHWPCIVRVNSLRKKGRFPCSWSKISYSETAPGNQLKNSRKPLFPLKGGVDRARKRVLRPGQGVLWGRLLQV